MPHSSKRILRLQQAATVVAATLLGVSLVQAGSTERPQFISLGDVTRAPIGWIDFCNQLPRECAGGPTVPRDVVLSSTAWKDLVRVNKWVVEKWSYPDDGYGDCEDYVLLKRRLLIEAGWPREALLITVVRDRRGDGHAVLTVKTDKGEYILDNQNVDIVLWSETGYRYVKRQSQSDPNVWVALGDQRPSVSTAASR
jgi:predicted transglutaminase-like cysteine proteinase